MSIGTKRRPPITEKRQRTLYRLHGRYRRLGQRAAVVGGLVGLGISALALLPALAADETVPLASFGIAVLLIATLALAPYLFVRWRWRTIRNRHED